MASVTKEEIPEIAAFDAEFWKVKKQYWIPETNNQEYWDSLWNTLGDLKKRFPHPYAIYATDAFAYYILFMTELAKKTGGATK